MTIRIQGETYETPEALAEVIASLKAELETMPSDTPERASLAAHIDKLAAALPDSTGDAPEVGAVTPGDSEDAAQSPAPAPDEDPEVETEEAPEPEDAEMLCPTCGAEWIYPDAPPVDPNASTCPDCLGWGVVATGSKVEGHITRNCPRCQAQGWVKTGDVAPQVEPPNAASTPELAGALWDVDKRCWQPPPGSQPPWQGATWDSFYGKWV